MTSIALVLLSLIAVVIIATNQALASPIESQNKPTADGINVQAKVPTSPLTIDHTATWVYTDPLGHQTTFTPHTFPLLTLDEAKRACEETGPGVQLASVISSGQLAFLQIKLKLFVLGVPTKVPNGNPFAFWVAGTDLYIDSVRGVGQYWFYSGLKIFTNFWNFGEPNNFEYGPHRVPETCTDLKVPALFPLAPFGLNDEVCTTELSYICQSPGIHRG